MARNALVTGAHGFIGRHVALALSRQGFRVTGLGHGKWRPEEWERWGISAWEESDVTLGALLTQASVPDAVVHCAGGGSVGYSVTRPYDDYLRTVASTAALLEFMRLYAPKAALVYPSSAAVYGHAARRHPYRQPGAASDIPRMAISPGKRNRPPVEQHPIPIGIGGGRFSEFIRTGPPCRTRQTGKTLA